MTRSKPTPGLVTVKRDHPTNACAQIMSGYHEICTLYGGSDPCKKDADGKYVAQPQRDADADFIADAFNVHHETGLTPQQLREQRDELLATVRDMLREFDDPTVTDDIKTQVGWSANTIKALQRARAAIAKVSA